ncbi:hypothetical protein GCM10009675_32650 [Prauserella alba]|uniref:Uncharacterized protein n=1 Tax=Prauserella alba TaxID=176898 RepID=A0ABN1VFY0_9PSEU
MPWVLRWLAKVPGALQLVNLVESFRPVEELTKWLGGIEPRRQMIGLNAVSLTRWHTRRPGVSGDDAARPKVRAAGEYDVILAEGSPAGRRSTKAPTPKASSWQKCWRVCSGETTQSRPHPTSTDAPGVDRNYLERAPEQFRSQAW